MNWENSASYSTFIGFFKNSFLLRYKSHIVTCTNYKCRTGWLFTFHIHPSDHHPDHRTSHHFRKLPHISLQPVTALQLRSDHFSDLYYHILVLQTSYNHFGELLTSLNIHLPSDSAIPFPVTDSREMNVCVCLEKNSHKNGHNTLIHNSPKLENHPNSH